MDRTWMYEARTTDAYRDGLRGFMAAAEASMLREGRADTCCPCKDCGNIRIFELCHIQFHWSREVSWKGIYIGVSTVKMKP